MEKGFSRISTPIKPLENSHMTFDESEDLENMLPQLKNKVYEISDSMLKLVDFSHSQERLRR